MISLSFYTKYKLSVLDLSVFVASSLISVAHVIFTTFWCMHLFSSYVHDTIASDFCVGIRCFTFVSHKVHLSVCLSVLLFIFLHIYLRTYLCVLICVRIEREKIKHEIKEIIYKRR
jgi:hypothetical protein